MTMNDSDQNRMSASNSECAHCGTTFRLLMELHCGHVKCQNCLVTRESDGCVSCKLRKFSPENCQSLPPQPPTPPNETNTVLRRNRKDEEENGNHCPDSNQYSNDSNTNKVSVLFSTSWDKRMGLKIHPSGVDTAGNIYKKRAKAKLRHYSCPYCSQIFHNAGGMGNHIKFIHKDLVMRPKMEGFLHEEYREG